MTGKRPSQALGQQLRDARNARGWRQEDLVARLEAIGAHGWRQSKITKIERGEVKRLTLDEALELAAALGVEPARLFSGGDVAVTSKLIVGPGRFRDWLRGASPLPRPVREEDSRIYHTALLSDEEWAELTSHPSAEVDLRDFPSRVAKRFQAEERVREYGRSPVDEEEA